jgi:beta-1,4-mannosyl-glycoprotein beta-1,4-N-acetylglucosaminyltransferase
MAEIYDCCMVHAEMDMLQTRMAILAPVVNYFVVVEAAETHSGKPKPYNVLEHIEMFREWEHMMIYVQVPDLTHRDGVADRNSWERERYHRFCISEGLKDAAPDDYIICGDCDEIANPETVKEVLRLKPDEAILEQDMYYYDLNHRVRQGWAIGMMRWRVSHDPNVIRTGAGIPHPLPHFDNGGWHFSYFGGARAVVEKVDAFMHHADPIIRDLPRDPVYVADKIAAGVDLYGRDGFTIERVPLSDTLPRYILDNLEKYRAMGWIKE